MDKKWMPLSDFPVYGQAFGYFVGFDEAHGSDVTGVVETAIDTPGARREAADDHDDDFAR